MAMRLRMHIPSSMVNTCGRMCLRRSSSSAATATSSTSTALSSHPRTVSKLSQLLLPTMRETDIPVGTSPSHGLLLRAGFIRPSAAGLFTLLPFGRRVLDKIQAIIDAEMEAVGCQKVDLPCMLPSTHWKTTGRYDTMGKEMFKITDRNQGEYVLAPTHEEEITTLVGSLITSYRQLPLRLYQIGRKYRDENRWRSGLLRAKEFIMKDLYTFDTNEENAIVTYNEIRGAYARVFNRIGVPFAVAEADTGSIGGTLSHEYHIFSPVGEDVLLECTTCDYAANIEQATTVTVATTSSFPHHDILDLAKSVDGSDVEGVLKMACRQPFGIRAVRVTASGEDAGSIDVERVANRQQDEPACHENTSIVPSRAIVVLQHDRKVNPLRIQKVLRDVDVSVNATNSGKIVVIDSSIHLDDVESIRMLLKRVASGSMDHQSPIIANVGLAKDGDACPSCVATAVSNRDVVVDGANAAVASSSPTNSSTLVSRRAIEVGHTFHLGTKYSLPLTATFVDTTGTETPIVMGCFGIGVSRLMPAIVEAMRDDKGMVWPGSIAPYRVCIVVVMDGGKRSHLKEKSNVSDHQQHTQTGLDTVIESVIDGLGGNARDVVVDDRSGVGFGAKMTDAELVGYPITVVVGRSFVKRGVVELRQRRDGNVEMLDPITLSKRLKDLL